MTKKLILFSMAYNSGMGRFVSALASAAAELRGSVLIAPEMDEEPQGIARVTFARGQGKAGPLGKLIRLLRFNFEAIAAVWKTAERGSIFVMIDLFSTVPLSVLPAMAARLRGAKVVLNLHDFYPHALRYPKKLRWLERWFFRASYRRFDLIATMTHDQSRRLVQEARFAPGRIVEIEHGAFPVQGIVHPTEDAPLRMLLLGSIRHNKNTLLSLDAVTPLTQAGWLTIRLAGAPRPEERGYWDECKIRLASIRQAEITSVFIPDDQLNEVLSGVHAIVCPYENFDSASGVGIVAVTNRIPLIATACAVPAELRANPQAWCSIASPVTADTIRNAIEAFAAMSRSEREAMAERAYRAFTARDHWAEAIKAVTTAFPE